MNQFDPLATPVIGPAAFDNSLQASFDAVAAAQPVGVFNKQIIITAVVAVISIAATMGIFAAVSHSQSVAAQEKLQRESRVVVL